MEKYLHFSVTDLAQEQSFIKWAQGRPSDDDWGNWILDNPSQKNKVQEAKEFVLAIKFEEESVSKEKADNLWNRIETATNRKRSKTTRRNIIRLSMALAASLALFITASTFLFNNGETIETGYAEIEKIELPDGSIVTLNAESKLSYDEDSWNENRKVKLFGEAFFEVEKGSTFTVITRRGSIEVLGTSFNIFIRKEKLDVQCETGSVRVITGSNETVLKPNESVSIENDQYEYNNDLSQKVLRSNWRTGVFAYKEKPLIEVLKDLERQLNLNFSLDKENELIKFSGSFNTSNGPEALSEVLWPLNLDYTIKDSQVIITKK